MSQEIELKLEVNPDDLPMIRQEPLFAHAECQSLDQVTVYYDTPETRLKKHGFTLRVRSVGGRFIQTVKPTTDSVGLVSREEIECEVRSLKPDLALLSDHPIRGLLGHGEAKRLKPLIRYDVNRTSWRTERRSGSIQIDLDHGSVTAHGRCEEFAELEFELVDGSPASLIIAARHLSDHVPVRLGVLTKAERGFMLGAGLLGRVAKAGTVHIDRRMTVAEAFETVVHACLRHYRLNEPIVIADRRAEALHQARVAMRRLRSAFTLFRPAVEDVEYQHLRNELRWFTAQLGDARNLDVYLERDLEDDERSKFGRKRERAYDEVVDAMNSHKFRRLLIDLVGWVALGAWRSGKIARRPVESFANRRLDRLWDSVTSDTEIAKMDEDRRHRVRIQGKKLRYAVEFLQELYPHARVAEKRFANAVEELQDSLGKLNDMATARKIADKAANDGWLIGSIEERRHLVSAERALRELKRVGPFWRRDGQIGAGQDEALA
ncbi:MAG TPA: CHAD domain-containing protein [Sphingomicrobium sp.]|nr:CHAD domain-containing protein [Sphingomicrobium sp.]